MAPWRRLDLRFPDRDLERSFWTGYFAENLHHIRIAIAIGGLLYTAFGILLRFRLDLPDSDTILRFGVAVPLIVVTLVSSFRPWFERVWRPIVALTIYVSAAVIAIGWSQTPAIQTTWSLAGTLLLIAFGVTFSRIGFTYGTLTGVAILITFSALATQRMAPLDQFFATFFLFAMVLVGGTTSFLLERTSRRLFVRERELTELLLNTFPRSIVERLRAKEAEIADSNPEVTVLFADLVDFTSHAASLSPEDVVEVLGRVFGRLDELTRHASLEKIKTVGDAYMVVAGAPEPRADHVEAAAGLSLAIVDEIPRLTWPNGDPIDVRVGMASGPVVSGVIGQQRFAYDLWGDTVNLASRLESSGEPGRIQVDRSVHDRLGDGWRFSEPRDLVLKGKGPTTTWFLLGRGPSTR